MGIVLQLPGLYLRGSIANVTMANMTMEQKSEVDKLSIIVSNHPEMAKHKAKFIKELSVTIKGDYAYDRASAEQDYLISIWRGVASLVLHRDYKFFCTHCQANSYITKRGKPKSIDRSQVPCPSCRCAKIETIGDTDYKPGDIINHDEAQTKYKHLKASPSFSSTIEPVAGDKKYNDPQSIINCPVQLKKFFGEFLWNYFRQQIKENKRKEHKKKPQDVTGPADEMILQSVIELCLSFKIFNYYHKIIPHNGFYSVSCNSLLTSPEFSSELASIILLGANYGVNIKITDNSIDIPVVHDAPIISIISTKSEHVTFLDQANTNEDEAGVYSVEQVSHKTVGGMMIDYDDHITITDIKDASEKIRDSLPDGDCKKVYDILRQLGPAYEEFSKVYGKSDPKINHIAEFLNITTRVVKQHKDSIRINCLAHGLLPHTI